MDDILKLAPLEERIYRHRCVEGWSIVVPWIGYSLSTILKLAEPTEKAKFVAFQSLLRSRSNAPGRDPASNFPYVEGLRLDEAMNPLTLLCVGMYGESLPNQDGAPVRLVIPWKYGFKSIKSIVKIRFVENMPPTTWNIATSQRVRLLLQRESQRRSSRAGVRPPNAAWANSSSAKRSCSTAIATKSPVSTTAWT